MNIEEALRRYRKKLRTYKSDERIPVEYIKQFCEITENLKNFIQSSTNDAPSFKSAEGKDYISLLLNYSFGSNNEFAELANDVQEKYRINPDLDHLMRIVRSFDGLVKDPGHREYEFFRRFCSDAIIWEILEIKKVQLGTVGRFTQDNPSRSITKDQSLGAQHQSGASRSKE